MGDTTLVATLRSQTGAGIVECKKALDESGDNLEKAVEILRKKGIAKASSKGERATKEGLVHAYVHSNNKVGVLVEIQCETDFVARTESFQDFVHDIALQVAASNPLYVSSDMIPAEVVEKEREIIVAEFAGSSKPKEIVEKIVSGKLDKYFEEICLLNQRFIKDEDVIIGDLLKQKISQTGENIKIVRFVRFALSEAPTC